MQARGGPSGACRPPCPCCACRLPPAKSVPPPCTNHPPAPTAAVPPAHLARGPRGHGRQPRDGLPQAPGAAALAALSVAAAATTTTRRRRRRALGYEREGGVEHDAKVGTLEGLAGAVQAQPRVVGSQAEKFSQ